MKFLYVLQWEIDEARKFKSGHAHQSTISLDSEGLPEKQRYNRRRLSFHKPELLLYYDRPTHHGHRSHGGAPQIRIKDRAALKPLHHLTDCASSLVQI